MPNWVKLKVFTLLLSAVFALVCLSLHSGAGILRVGVNRMDCRRFALGVCALLFACLVLQVPRVNAADSYGTPNPGASAPAQSAHVILIVEENRSFSSVYPHGMPWLSRLGNQYGIATNYWSDEAGSMLDYLWLSSGSGELQFGCGGWGCLRIITSDNIFRDLNRGGLSWKVYADSLPYPGFMGTSSGEYVKRHNPAPWYSDVAYHPSQQKKMVPFTQFAHDLSAHNLPNYSLIVPNLLHDAHDGTMAMADDWLRQNITPLLKSSYFKTGGNGALFITFDNANGDHQGHVFTGVVGPVVIHGEKVDRHFRHQNTLRTMMELLGFTHFPGASEHAAPMLEFFK